MQQNSSPINKVIRRCIVEFHLGYARLVRRVRRVSSMRRVMTALIRMRAVLTGFGVAVVIIPSTFAVVGRLLLVFCFLFYRWLNDTNPFRVTDVLHQFISSKAKKISYAPSSKRLGAELEDVCLDLEVLIGVLTDLLDQWEQVGYSRWQINLRMIGYGFGASWAVFCIVFTKLLGTSKSLR